MLREGGHTMMDNVTPFRNMRFKKLDRGEQRVRWHAEVAVAIRAAIEPLSQKAPPGESIEVLMRIATKGSEAWVSYFLDRRGVTGKTWTDKD
jgi:hypothetical protein